MRVRVGADRLSLLLLFAALLGLFVLQPPGSAFAELDEPPGLAEPAGNRGSVLQGDEDRASEQYLNGLEAGQAAGLDNLRLGVLIAVSWVFLAVGLTLVALTLRKTCIWLKAVQRARVPPTRYFNLLLQVRNRDGLLGLYNFDYYPVVVAASGSADLLLPGVQDKAARFRVDYSRGRAELLSDASLIVNGVPRQHKPLKQDDRIIFGPYRLIYKEASIQEQSHPVPGKPAFVWQFPVVALLLALSVLFRQAGAVPQDRMLLAKAAELQKIEGQQTELAEVEDRGPPAVQPAEEVAVAQVAEQRSAAPAQPIGRQESRDRKSPEQKTEVQKTEARKPEAQTPGRQKPSAVAAVEVDFHAGQGAGAGLADPPTADPAAIPASGKKESPPDPRVHDVSDQAGRKAAASQPLPARAPVLSSGPPVEATVEVPAPRPVEVSTAQEVSTPARRRETQRAPALQASVLGTVSPHGVQLDGINPLEAFGFTKARSEPQIGRVKVRVIPPGRKPEYFKADILFIHAHPDDESIDFGSLMAKASRSNKRIVTLLFTDGESGLDLYPERKVGDIYPARDLTGGALSQVRVVEAARALSILGSEMYVRWGLQNRPYNSKADEVPPDEVIRGWGGEEQLVERLVELIEGFRPTVVVSPDRHSGAYEHFEHEAVGQLVQTALERLRRDSGAAFVKGYIVSIDPYQVDRYSGVVEVNAQARDGQSGLAYRAIQALALKEHVSQRDAAVTGVSRLSHLPGEYYKALYWDLDLSLQEYLK